MRTHTMVGGVLALALLAVLGVLGWSAQAVTRPARTTTEPPADTIVRVIGDAANGFGIKRYDGSWLFPPTDSEARAECGAYDRRVDRVRCRTEVRTWYRDLAALQQSLAWARAGG